MKRPVLLYLEDEDVKAFYRSRRNLSEFVRNVMKAELATQFGTSDLQQKYKAAFNQAEQYKADMDEAELKRIYAEINKRTEEVRTVEQTLRRLESGDTSLSGSELSTKIAELSKLVSNKRLEIDQFKNEISSRL